MKNEENNLEKNISRLVKLAGDSNQPNKTFTDSLINGALNELTQKAGTAARERKSTIMTAKKIFAYAASILVVCGVMATVLMMSKTQQARQIARDMPKPAIEEQYEVKSKSEQEPAKIEYTQADKPTGEIVGLQSAPSSAIRKPTEAYTDNTLVVAKSKEEASITSSGQSVNQRFGMIDGRNAETKGVVSDASRFIEPADRFETTGLSKVGSSNGYGVHTSGERMRCFLPSQPPACRMPAPVCRPPMAHGGTTPPNGEDVEAMFFKNYGVNPFIDTEDDHLSTFATDVDTGSYTVVRGYLHDGHLPTNDAVRVEEFVNYFKYDYPAPKKDDFAVYAEASPWQFGTERKNSYLLRLALKARQVSAENRKPAILTFVIDVSGSMAREDRLGLVKKSLRILTENLRPDDKIGIAIYGSRGSKLMSHKGLDEKDEILTTIETLYPSGSTYAEEGIRIGYEMAEKAFKKGCINRVILCSDGVANVGQTGADDILKVIKENADKGITLSAIGFGMGNYNDVLMEQLGDKGNGHYAYIDTIEEAKRLFEDNLPGTLEVIARDVKVQVDFNPEVVRSYRLIGYENRDVPDDKFRDDKYDGGELGAGHSATALYELKLWPGKKGNIATTYVRYKDADSDAVTEFKSQIGTGNLNRNFDSSSKQFRLAATVAEFAEILRKSYWAKGATLEQVLNQARQLQEDFKGDADVIELSDLISKANRLMPKPEPQPEPVEITTETE
jgi:Ca-activated chloride channel family protein